MVKHLTLTLTAAVQSLADAYAAVSGVTADQPAAADLACQSIVLQPDGANANPIYVGGASDGTLSSTVHGFRLEKGNAGVPPLPLILVAPNGGPMRASDVKVLGTAAEKLHALLISS